MRIDCPHCGSRDIQEFVYRGDASVLRPDPEREDAYPPDGAQDASPGSLSALGGPLWTATGGRGSECLAGVGDREGPRTRLRAHWSLSRRAAVSLHD